MVPGDVRRAVRGLAEDRQIAILVVLLKEGHLPFSEIKERLELHQQQITTALNRMQDAGLIVQEDVVSEDTRYESYYRATSFSKRVLENLFDSLDPTNDEVKQPVIIGSFGEERYASEYYDRVETTRKKESSKKVMNRHDQSYVSKPSTPDLTKGQT